jgi:chemotaxis protein MotB
MSQQRLLLDQQAAIDTLSTTNAGLVRSNRALVDSIAYFDYLESGQYDRDMRALTETVDRLTYDLEIVKAGGITIAEEAVDRLFQPASARLSPPGEQILDALADRIADFGEGYFRIEGHADSTLPGGQLRDRYPSNWELTAARASRVARFLIDEAGVAPDRLEVVSYGSSRPVASNQTAEGRRANRRIRVAFQPDAPD